MCTYWRAAISLVLLMPALSGLARGDLYRYQRPDGSVVITDDGGKVPEDQQERSRVQEPERKETPKTDERNETRNSRIDRPAPSLSLEDEEFLKMMRDAGIISSDDDGSDITSEQVAILRLAAEHEGLDSEYIRKNRKPDPRYATPEETWTVFKEALISGKTEDAMNCFLPRSAKRYREIFSAMGKKKSAELGRNMQAIQRITSDEKRAKFRIRRNESGLEITYYIYFNHLWGNWKIDRF